MKTIMEFQETEMGKVSANLSPLSIPAMATIPTAAAVVAGNLYSKITSPAHVGNQLHDA